MNITKAVVQLRGRLIEAIYEAGLPPVIVGFVGYAEKLQDGGRAGFCVDVHQQPQRLQAAGHEHDG